MNRTDVGALGTDDREGREPDETDPRRAGNGDEGGAATPGEKASGEREAERERRSRGTDRRKNRPLED